MSWDKSLNLDTLGPLGFPCTDKQAKELDSILKELPKDCEPGVAKLIQPPAEVSKEGRFDISWITTEEKDHQRDIVISKGMKDHIYRQNPIVTWNHDYEQPAVGLNEWIKPATLKGVKGLKAKTNYPMRPDDWEGIWVPDQVLNLVDMKLLPGKSIGFLPIKHRRPTQKEISSNSEKYSDVRYIVEEWLLLEYSVETMPANGQCLREHCQKGTLHLTDWMWKSLGVDASAIVASDDTNPNDPPATPPTIEPPNNPKPPEAPKPPPVFPFTTRSTFISSLRRAIGTFDHQTFANDKVKETVDRFLGRV